MSSVCWSSLSITFDEFIGHNFKQIIAISMGINCAPLLANLFLYPYEAEFIQTRGIGPAPNNFLQDLLKLYRNLQNSKI
jgi:hypothetical protein